MARDTPTSGKGPFIVGVAGGTASGKSLATEKIVERLGLGPDKSNKQVNMISLDSFYRELTPDQQEKAVRGEYDFDHPSAFEFGKCIAAIKRLSNGEAVDIPVYDFVENKITGSRRLESTDVLIVEGILVFYDKELRDMFNVKLFVDADADIRLARRVRRDTIERRRPLSIVLNHYIKKVKPAFEEFCLPTKKYADVIIPKGGENDVAIELLVQHVHWTDVPTDSFARHKNGPVYVQTELNDVLRSPRDSPNGGFSFDADDIGSSPGDTSSASGRSSRKSNRPVVGRPH